MFEDMYRNSMRKKDSEPRGYPTVVAPSTLVKRDLRLKVSTYRALRPGEHGDPGDAENVPFDTEHGPFCGSLHQERAPSEEERGAIDEKRASRSPFVPYERGDR